MDKGGKVSDKAIAIQADVTDVAPRAMSTAAVLAQVAQVQEIMAKVMHKGEHYDTLPGTDKPALLKAGAEKLSFTFRLLPKYRITARDMPNLHREYEMVCELWHESGVFAGEGVGNCSTMESKYRWRTASRKCPTCGKEAIIKGKTEYGGGWICYKKKDGCGSKFADDDVAITGQTVGRVENPDIADMYNCVTPDTRLLTHDLRWVRAGDIQTGDVLIGVQEQMDDQYARHLAVGEATVYGTKEDTVYEVAFEDGRMVRCNGEHGWLVKKVGLKGTEWVATQDIYHEIAERDGRPRHWSVMSLCAPWDEDAGREAGYVAGLLDADGSLAITSLIVVFAQQANIVLSRMEAALETRGYAIGKSKCKTAEHLAQCESKEQVYGLRVLGGLAEQMRLLGSIRPPRLLERWLTLFDLSKRRLEGRGSGAGTPARIKSITIIGTEEIVLLGSSCGTYIAEGLVCHNTVLKMAKKRAHVDAVITACAASDIFTQDVEQDEVAEPRTVTPPEPPPTPKPPKKRPADQAEVVAEIVSLVLNSTMDEEEKAKVRKDIEEANTLEALVKIKDKLAGEAAWADEMNAAADAGFNGDAP